MYCSSCGGAVFPTNDLDGSSGTGMPRLEFTSVLASSSAQLEVGNKDLENTVLLAFLGHFRYSSLYSLGLRWSLTCHSPCAPDMVRMLDKLTQPGPSNTPN